MSIIILPYGGLGKKIMSLMGAIDLQKRTNKKINIWFTKQYDDLLFDTDNFLLNDLPEFNFKNISYELKEFEINKDYGLHLQRLLIYKKMNESAIKYSKDNKLKIYKFGLIGNKYPEIESGIIEYTWIRGFKNEGLQYIKDWLSDITKYRIYDKFIKNVGFDWINPDRDLVYIHIPISIHFESIFYNLSDRYILSPQYYEDALKIIKNKTNKKLQIFIKSDIDKVYLSDYFNIISKFGNITNENIFYPQSYTLLICSKAQHFIGSADSLLYIIPSIFSKKNTITILPTFEVLNKNDYTDNVIYLDENKYKLDTTRRLNNLSIKFSLGYKPIHLNNEYQSVYYHLESMKDKIYDMYNKYYTEFDKNIKSKYLKNLLLYKVLLLRNKVRIVHSGISIKEGMMIYKLIKQNKPKKIIEIGLACGISACYMLCAITPGDKVYSVDPFQKIQWDRFGLINANNIVHELNLPSNTHHWIPKYSYDYFNFTNDKYDFMLIDGDHSYEGTMIDLNGSLKILNKKGILAVDDILHDDVGKAVNDFIKKYNNKFVKINTNVKTMGFYIKQS